MMTFNVANISTSPAFIKRIKTTYSSKITILTDGTPYYKASCRTLKLKHELYSLEIRNFMERIIQLINYLITICHKEIL
jgi:transposase-like protein